MKKISIVSGCYNEEKNIKEFLGRVNVVMNKMPQFDYEIIVIDNCSTDRSHLRSKIKAVLKSPGPVLCEVLAQANQKISPVVPSKMLPDGSIKSMALHEMVPEIGYTLEALQRAAGIFNKRS